jgi:mono/diheme cytochrome c family protein
MPRWIPIATLIAVALSWIPLVLIARDRTSRSESPRMSIVRDMDHQPRFEAQEANPLFMDGRADRRPVAGTVPQGGARLDEAFHDGKENGEWVEVLPVRVTDGLLKQGRERYDIYCSVCHGLDGAGNGPIAQRADALQEGTWVPPSSLHTDAVRARPVGHLYNSISNGIRNMPSYRHQIEETDRWAVVAYIRALQRSQNARLDDVPTEYRRSMR